jgi:prophage regulatory protein
MRDGLPRIVTKQELRLIVPYTPQHILRLEKLGKFPKRIRIGARRVGWYLTDIEGWLAKCQRGSPECTDSAARADTCAKQNLNRRQTC